MTTKEAIQLAVNSHDALVEALLKEIPTNWLDSLLTGPDAVIGKGPWGCPDIERLLAAIKERQQKAALRFATKPVNDSDASSGTTAHDGAGSSVASISPNNNESNIKSNLLFCDTCHVPAMHKWIDDKWECTGPAHLVIQNKKLV